MELDKDFYLKFGALVDHVSSMDEQLKRITADHERRLNDLEACTITVKTQLEPVASFVKDVQGKILAGFLTLLVITGTIILGVFEYFKNKQ